MKKRINRRDFLRLSAGLAAGAVAVACAPAAPEVVEVQKEVPVKEVVVQTVEVEKIVEKEVIVTPKPEKPVGPVTVTFWGWWKPRMDLYENAAKNFMEANPDVKVEVQTLPWDTLWEKVLPATAAGTGPTILKEKPTYYFKYLINDLLEPYPEHLFPDSWWEENFSDTWEAYRYQGRNYVYTAGSMAMLLMYNRTMFSEAGLDPNTPPKTWDEMVEMGKKLVEYDGAGKITIAGLILGEFPWLHTTYQLGGSLVKVLPDGTRVSAMTSPEAEQALRFLTDLYVKHKITPGEFLGYSDAIGTSKAAMGLNTSWIVGAFASDFPDTLEILGWAPPPTPTGEPPYGLKRTVLGLSVFAPRPPVEKEAAFEYIEYLLKESDEELADIAEIIGSLPGKISVRQAPRFVEKEALRVAVEVLPLEKNPIQATSHLSETEEKAIDRVVLEGIPVEESLQIANEEWNGFLEEGDAPFMV